MNLYNELAAVYEAMYQTFIDYEAEYVFYSELIEKYGKKSVLEIGSGTGHLAPYFMNNGFEYTGLDYSKDMIDLATSKTPNAKFIQGDMRDFQLEKPLESIIITARTISYLLENSDINKTFSSIYDNLQPNGILCFDFIDANEFIPFIHGGKTVIHEANFENIDYYRKSFWASVFDYGMGFQWYSTYYQKEGTTWLEIGQDNSRLRTFMVNEMELFLTINHFKIKEVIPKASYAFPTFVVVAEKIGG